MPIHFYNGLIDKLYMFIFYRVILSHSVTNIDISPQICYVILNRAPHRSPEIHTEKRRLTGFHRKDERFMKIEIPGYPSLDLKYLLLDYNGTIALDGIISEAVANKIRQLSDLFHIYVLTADTNGTARQMCEGLPVDILTFPNDAAMQEKQNILYSLGKENCAAIGNGRNDLLMCREAAFSVSVLGQEGMYGRLMTATDLCVPSILDAMELFLKPHRIIASLRG